MLLVAGPLFELVVGPPFSCRPWDFWTSFAFVVMLRFSTWLLFDSDGDYSVTVIDDHIFNKISIEYA